MTNSRNPAMRVVVIDASSDSRSLLVELLSHGGAAAIGFAAWDAQAASSEADVVVADCDAIDPATIRSIARDAGKDAAIVVSGTNRPAIVGSMGVTFVRKPYHYRELLHKIWASANGCGSSVKAAA